ncbi:MAG: fimbrillin family protein [Rikenellaceae bacterium]
MKKLLYIIGMAVATIFAACQKDADVEDNPNGDRAVAFSAESIAPLTRVSGSSWKTGDQIGITMVSSDYESVYYDNVKYIADGEGASVTFSPDSEIIYYPDGGPKVCFMAFYPYQEGWSFETYDMAFDISAQDGTAEAQSLVDLLISPADTDQSSGECVLFFEHFLSKVQITVSNFDEEVSAFADLTSLTASMKSYYTQFNIFSEEREPNSEAKELKMVKSQTDDNTATFSIIIQPGAVSEEITFTDGTHLYTAHLEIEEAVMGTQYNFNAVVGDQGIDIVELVSDSVTDWGTQAESVLSSDLKIVDGVYQIYTAKGLKIFAETVNSGEASLEGKLMNDIDLEGSEDNQWTTIGNVTNKYEGKFDGGGFKVSGLYINKPSSSYLGLFGYTIGATICNLGVDGNVTGDASIGSIVGCTNSGSTLSNCYNTGAIIGSFSVGGITGSAIDTTINSCYNTGAVTSTNTTSSIGSIVGSTYNASLNDCYFNSDVFSGYALGSDRDGRVITEGGYSTAFMQSSSFVTYLNNGAYTYNNNDPSPEIKACAWRAVPGDYPVLDGESEPTYIDTDECTNFGSGSTESDPYLIFNSEQMRDLANDVNSGTTYSGKFFKMVCDIDLGGESNEFTAIGNTTYPFKGSFDGDGYSITELYIDTNIIGQGVFRYVENSTIKNLKVGGSVSNAHYHTALIAGSAINSKFVSCSTLEGSTVTCTANNNTAGITGYVENTDFEDCHNSASINGRKYSAGIVGYCSSESTFTNCSNSGVISGSDEYAGGVVAFIRTNSTISNCYNTGSVTGTGAYAGGVVGYVETSSVNICYSTGTVSGSSKFGGVVGDNVSGSITSCFYDSTIYTGSGVGSGSGDATGCSTSTMQSSIFVNVLNNEAYTYNESSPETKACAWVEVSGDYPTLDINATPTTTSISCTEIGSGSESDPYLIINSEQMRDLSNDVNDGTTYSGKYFEMVRDIDLGGESNEFTAIGKYTSDSSLAFQGTFDGGGYEISGLYINKTDSRYQGLFGHVYMATIQNLGVSGSVTVTVTVAGTESDYDSIGGVIGTVYTSTVSDCYSKVSVYGTRGTGGVVGSVYSNSTISRCYNTESVTGTGAYVGGVIGFSFSSSINNCYNTAAVVGGGSHNGGVVGYNNRSTISYCYNTGNVEGSYKGGVVGYDYHESTPSYYTVSNCLYDSSVFSGSAIGRSYNGNLYKTEGLDSLTSDMKKDAFVTTLGSDNWKEDTNKINDGYPILIWQATE